MTIGKKLVGRRDRILLYSWTFLGFYLLFGIFSLVMRLKGMEYPIGHFLFFPADRFKDFSTINHAVDNMNPYMSGLSNYPPIILLFACIFAKIGDFGPYDLVTIQGAINEPSNKLSLIIFICLYVVSMIAVIACYVIRNKGELTRKITLLSIALLSVMLVLSAPSVFAIDRANYILVSVVLFVIWAIFEHEEPDSMLGAVMLGLCAGIKFYPIYICAMYFFDFKWKKLLVAIGTFLASVLIPIAFFKGGYIDNLKAFADSMFAFGDGSGFYFLYFNVGVTGMCGYAFRAVGLHPITDIIRCVWLCAGVGLTLIGMLHLREEKETWLKLLIVTCLMVFLTPNAYLYCSAFLIAPLLIMLFGNIRLTKREIPYLIMTALLMVPKAYHYLPNMTEWGIPGEYNTINCAVFFDGLLYFAIIIYYIFCKTMDFNRKYKADKINAIKETGTK